MAVTSSTRNRVVLVIGHVGSNPTLSATHENKQSVRQIKPGRTFFYRRYNASQIRVLFVVTHIGSDTLAHAVRRFVKVLCSFCLTGIAACPAFTKNLEGIENSTQLLPLASVNKAMRDGYQDELKCTETCVSKTPEKQRNTGLSRLENGY